MKKKILKSDKYKKARGGYSRLLKISCAKCDTAICFYQKDGPGLLKRMYIDRISGSTRYANLQNVPMKSPLQMVCPNCKELLGVPMIYKKEHRPAYRLFVGSIAKKIVNSQDITL